MASPNLQSQLLPSREAVARVPRRWLTLARGVWIACALLLLANFVASIPAYYRILLTICTLPIQTSCNMPGQSANPSGQLTAHKLLALASLHVSVAAFAATVVTLYAIVSLFYWGVGLLIFWRKSNGGLGLFVSLLLVLFGATGVNGYFLGAWASMPVPPPLQILLLLITIAQWMGLVAFLLTFPTGRFAPRWSWLFILGNISYGVLQGTPLLTAADLLVLFGCIFFIMVYRYRRVFDAAQRQQTKWFVYAFAIGLPAAIISAATPTIAPPDSPFQLLSPTLNVLSLVAIPFGVGIAILRYRLWDIDAIINRTLVYGTLTVLLALLYTGLIIGLQSLLSAITEQGNNDIAIVVSTLVIYALFWPLRRRLQNLIDRRFYRRKYDATKVLAAFSATLRNEVDLDQLREQLVSVVEESMQPAHVSLWLRPREHVGTQQALWGATPPASSEGS
jgi:hypothetical protein